MCSFKVITFFFIFFNQKNKLKQTVFSLRIILSDKSITLENIEVGKQKKYFVVKLVVITKSLTF